MNTDYNFMKRFKSSFKNKVRITPGLMIAMLITGNVAMAVGSTIDYSGSGYDGYSAYSGYTYNIDVNDTNTSFTSDILDPVDGLKENSKLIVASVAPVSNDIHNTGTINITENTGGLLSEEYFVGARLIESSDRLHNNGDYNVSSLNSVKIIGAYYGYNYSDYNTGTVNISTDSHGIGYYFSDGGTLDNYGTINADTALVMTSETKDNTLTNTGTINGDVVMNTSSTNKVTLGNNYFFFYGASSNDLEAIINGNITFSGGGDNYLTYNSVDANGTGNIYGDESGYNELSVSGGYNIEKNIYDFNVLKISGSAVATLAEGYEVSMNPQESYTSSSGTSTGLTVDGTLTLNTELSGSDILVPKIETYGGDITVSETGKIKFYVSGTGTLSSYDIVFGDDLTTTNVISDGNLVAEDGDLEYNDELFVETLGWNVTNIDESGTQTVVTLGSKDVYDELREEVTGSTGIINILDDEQNMLSIHEKLSNIAMDDAETAVSELSGEVYGTLSSEYIQRTKMFTGKINSMMISPLTLRGQRQSDFALLLENSTAELSSDTFTLSPNYSFLEGEEKYIQHFDILGSTGSYDRSGVEYDTHASGFIGITEKVTGKNSSVGISYGYFDARNDYEDGSDAETETFHLGMTHKLYFGNEYMLASHMGAEYSKNDVTREITTLDLQANSDYNSYSVGIGTDLSKNIQLSERIALVPSAGIAYSRITRESFTESGSIGMAGLDVEKHSLDSVTSKLGLRLDMDLTDKIVWFVGGSWEHEYADLNKDQEASFVGDADSEIFDISGVNIDEDLYTLSTGFNFNVNDALSYRIIYSYTQEDDLDENNIDLGVSWKF